MSEMQSACDIENHLNEAKLIRTRAVRSGKEWIINGAKHWASNSGIADLHCLACNMDPKSGVEGFALIYIPEPWDGVAHGKYEVKRGVSGDRNTSAYFDNAKVPIEWGLQGPEAWDLFLNNVVSAFAMNIAQLHRHAAGSVRCSPGLYWRSCGRRQTNPRASLYRDVFGRNGRRHFCGKIRFPLSCAISSIIRKYTGPAITDSMVGKARSSLSLIARMANDLISRGMEFMGAQGYAREGLYERYYREVAAAKLVLAACNWVSLSGCRAFYPLDFSSFGPGKL